MKRATAKPSRRVRVHRVVDGDSLEVKYSGFFSFCAVRLPCGCTQLTPRNWRNPTAQRRAMSWRLWLVAAAYAWRKLRPTGTGAAWGCSISLGGASAVHQPDDGALRDGVLVPAVRGSGFGVPRRRGGCQKATPRGLARPASWPAALGFPRRPAPGWRSPPSDAPDPPRLDVAVGHHRRSGGNNAVVDRPFWLTNPDRWCRTMPDGAATAPAAGPPNSSTAPPARTARR